MILPVPNQVPLLDLSQILSGLGMRQYEGVPLQSAASSSSSSSSATLVPATQMRFDELECTLGLLISERFINAYIHHDKRLLVLSKAAPFSNLKNLSEQRPKK